MFPSVLPTSHCELVSQQLPLLIFVYPDIPLQGWNNPTSWKGWREHSLLAKERDWELADLGSVPCSATVFQCEHGQLALCLSFLSCKMGDDDSYLLNRDRVRLTVLSAPHRAGVTEMHNTIIARKDLKPTCPANMQCVPGPLPTSLLCKLFNSKCRTPNFLSSVPCAGSLVHKEACSISKGNRMRGNYRWIITGHLSNSFCADE